MGGYNAGAPADSVTVVPVADATQPFTRALDVTRGSAGINTYDAALTWSTIAPVKKGDLLVATFRVRSLGPAGETLRLETSFQQSDKPFNSAFFGNIPVDTGVWRSYAVPFRADIDYPAGTASFQVRYGLAVQRFEIGGVSVANHGALATIPPDLAATFAFYYPGRGDANAPWRIAALAGIASHRRAAITVRVVDGSGAPVPGASVSIKQTAAAFDFGSELSARYLLCSNRSNAARPCLDLSDADKSKYQTFAKQEFNALSFGNDLKWPEWEEDAPRALDGMKWIVQSGRRFSRGHNIFWPGFDPAYKLPRDINPGSSPALVEARARGHIADMLAATAGRIPEWDVINEPWTNFDLQGRIAIPGVEAKPGLLPTSTMADWFVRARTADPAAALFINEYNIFDNYEPVKAAHTEALIKYINGLGGRVDGIGFQAHFGGAGPVFADMARSVAQFDPLVTRMAVTEFDFTTLDPALGADILRDVLTFAYGAPKFTGFQMWGFWDGQHWLGSGPLFNRDWTRKPSGEVWRELTRRTWRTAMSARTDTTGVARLGGYKGDYVISVARPGLPACVTTASITSDRALTLSTAC